MQPSQQMQAVGVAAGNIQYQQVGIDTRLHLLHRIPAVGGSLYAVGGLKGTMLALAVELICCALTGAALSHEVASMHTNEGPPLRLGQSFIAIDPGALAGSEVYRLAGN